MSRLAKTSKFRHTQPHPSKGDKIWTGIKASSAIWDCSNLVAANSKYWAMSWQGTGGGKMAIWEHGKPCKSDAHPPMITGHSAPIIDWTFHPYNDSLLCTGSEDCTIKLWSIPEGGVKEDITEPVVSHEGHSKKVGILSWHPSANHVLASASLDHAIKLWDVEKGERQAINVHEANILSINWNLDGSLMMSTCKDKKVRVIDPRAGKVASEVDGHEGVKTCRGFWAKRRNQLVTCGFSKRQERQMMVWDPAKMDAPLHTEEIDSASGVMMPFYDEDTSMIYIGGKGDGNVRYYELWSEGPTPITELDCFASSTPAKGLCFLPKSALDVKGCEIARMLKLEATCCTPVSFKLPRKSAATEFQEDVYPPSFAAEPAIDAQDFFGGKNAEPKTMDMKPFWEGKGQVGSGAAGAFKASSEKLVTDKDIANAEEQVKKAEEALKAAQDALEKLKEKKKEQEAPKKDD